MMDKDLHNVYMILMHEFRLLELWIEMNAYDSRSFVRYLSSGDEKSLKNPDW